MLGVFLKYETHNFIDAGEEPDNDGLVPRVGVDLEGGAGVVGSSEEGELAVDVN